jgi:hypothetical protein
MNGARLISLINPRSIMSNLGNVGHGTSGSAIRWTDVLLALAGNRPGWLLLCAKYGAGDSVETDMRSMFPEVVRLTQKVADSQQRKPKDKTVVAIAAAVLTDYCKAHVCEVCDGVGTVPTSERPDTPRKECSACRGTGHIRVSQRSRAAAIGVAWSKWPRFKELYEGVFSELLKIEDDAVEQVERRLRG